MLGGTKMLLTVIKTLIIKLTERTKSSSLPVVIKYMSTPERQFFWESQWMERREMSGQLRVIDRKYNVSGVWRILPGRSAHSEVRAAIVHANWRLAAQTRCL